jgi:DNA-binding HxlR family transcriptional regulator
MREEKLPTQVIDFIAGYIDTALQLEILLLLRNHAERSWTATEIDAELRINQEWVASQLGELCRCGLLRCTQDGAPTYQYGPTDPKVASAITALASWHATHRVAIISMIYSKPADKLRSFADAFRLRKDKPNG